MSQNSSIEYRSRSRAESTARRTTVSKVCFHATPHLVNLPNFSESECCRSVKDISTKTTFSTEPIRIDVFAKGSVPDRMSSVTSAMSESQQTRLTTKKSKIACRSSSRIRRNSAFRITKLEVTTRRTAAFHDRFRPRLLRFRTFQRLQGLSPSQPSRY